MRARDSLGAPYAPLLAMLPSLRRLFIPRVYVELHWLVQIPQLTSVQLGASLFHNSLQRVKATEVPAVCQSQGSCASLFPHTHDFERYDQQQSVGGSAARRARALQQPQQQA